MAATKSAAKSPRAAKKTAPAPKPVARTTPAIQARAIMRGARQSPYKMRLVIDEIRGKSVNDSLDVDNLVIKLAIINEGRPLKRFTPAAMGRATPIRKRTSHVEIIVA